LRGPVFVRWIFNWGLNRDCRASWKSPICDDLVPFFLAKGRLLLLNVYWCGCLKIYMSCRYLTFEFCTIFSIEKDITSYSYSVLHAILVATDYWPVILVEAFQSGAWFNIPYANMIFSLFFLICATSSEFWYFHFLIQCISFEQSKYIAQLKEKAEIRKREQDIIYERKLQKERSKEDHLFGDKDKFVTSAYRKKLEEQQKWLEEERIRQLREEKEDVSFIHLFAVILCTCIFVFMSS
jgi:hypothetical protein